MSLKGKAAVAIWHDLLPEATDAFYQWHNREHMPERMAIPGFERGRRYLALSAGPRYFNLYEARDMSVLAGAAYLERLNNPTEWTRDTVAAFRDVARSTCDVRYSAGIGQGGYIATLTFEAPDALDAAAAALAGVVSGVGIAGAHLLVDDGAVSSIETSERAARGEASNVPPHIVLIEGVSEAHVAAAAESVCSALDRQTRVPIIMTLYVLEHAIDSANR